MSRPFPPRVDKFTDDENLGNIERPYADRKLTVYGLNGFDVKWKKIYPCEKSWEFQGVFHLF